MMLLRSSVNGIANRLFCNSTLGSRPIPATKITTVTISLDGTWKSPVTGNATVSITGPGGYGYYGGGGGGGGGAFAQGVVAVISGNSYAIKVSPGYVAKFDTGTVVSADKGQDATTITGAVGGATANSKGTTLFAGGKGGKGAVSGGGGGGGAAASLLGNGAVGGDATTTSGGLGGVGAGGAGSGGKGGTTVTDTNGHSGIAPGGGTGGGAKLGSSYMGATGQVVISYSS